MLEDTPHAGSGEGRRARQRRARGPLPDRTSSMLHALAYGSESERVSFGDMAAGLRHRALGFSLLAFALPCCLPMPPGIPTACGVIIGLIALHLLAGREKLWLPRWIARRSVARADMRRLVDRAHPRIERFEKLCRPRFKQATERPAKALIGIVVLILAILLILPIPFLGNLPPGIAAAVIALGLSERDGVVIVIGLLLAAVAAVLASGMAWAAIEGVRFAL